MVVLTGVCLRAVGVVDSHESGASRQLLPRRRLDVVAVPIGCCCWRCGGRRFAVRPHHRRARRLLAQITPQYFARCDVRSYCLLTSQYASQVKQMKSSSVRSATMPNFTQCATIRRGEGVLT
jgi:hypothetical protein